ncbi:MAG: Ig-like domain-containing protein, partial [Armatimonadia bacterium]
LIVMTKKASSYSLSDLAGTWYSVTLATGPMAPWWERATWSFSADGSFTASQVRSNGQSSNVSGSCSLSSSGTVTVPGYSTFQGRLDAGKTVIAATDTWGDGTTTLSVMVKLAPGVGGAMISSSSPAPLATGCLRSAPVDITFSSPVLAASAQSHFSLLAQGTTPVAGSFSWPTPGLQMRFQPSSLLPAGTVMAVRLAPGIEGGDGRVRDWGESFTFTTATAPAAPTVPTAVTIAPTAPGPENLTATATGSTDANGDTVTYQYQWSKKTGTTWSAWGNTGQTLAASNVKIGEIWRVRARAYDGALYGPWKAGSSSVTIVSMAGVTPAPKTYNVPTTTCVFATFRWPVQQSTVTSRVQLKLGTTKVIPTVMTWVTAERKIKLRPRSALLPNTYYRINIDPGIQCTSGRVLGWGENYWFKTAPATTTAAVTVAATPTSSGAQFSLNLTSAATVHTVISNIAGRVIAELPERDLPAGVSSLLWNGMSNTGSKVPAGTYLVRVVANASEGTQTSAIAPLQIR